MLLLGQVPCRQGSADQPPQNCRLTPEARFHPGSVPFFGSGRIGGGSEVIAVAGRLQRVEWSSGGRERQAQIPFDSAQGRFSTRCARSGRQGLLEVEIRAVPPFRKSSVVGPARAQRAARRPAPRELKFCGIPLKSQRARLEWGTRQTAGAEAHVEIAAVAARLMSYPDTFFCTGRVLRGLKPVMILLGLRHD